MGIAIVLIIVFIAGCVYYNWQKSNRLISEGKIIKRTGLFYEEAEEFTLVVQDTSVITQKIKSFSYSEMHVSMKGNSESQEFHFTGSSFEAQLWRKGEDAGKTIYRFQFTKWRSNKNGAVYGIYDMNMLLTAVEKMFLSVDPSTQVKTTKLETKTKPKFF